MPTQAKIIVSQDSSCTELPVINIEFCGVYEDDDGLKQIQSVFDFHVRQYIEDNNLTIPEDQVDEMIAENAFYDSFDHPSYELHLISPEAFRVYHADIDTIERE